MKHSWLLLAGLVIFLGSSIEGYGEPVEEDLETITLSTPLHFLSPAEEDVTVPPGTYAITIGEDGMQLDSTTGFESYIIDSQPNTHTEKLALPGALLIPGDNDLQYLTVLFPWGESFEAVGSRSGIIPRGDFKIPTKRFCEFYGKLQQRMAAAQKKQPVMEMEEDCLNLRPKQISRRARKCNSGKACRVWDPPLSNRCKAMGQRKATIDYSYFGKTDCRTNRSPRRKNQKVTKIVLHNGDRAKANKKNWECRPATAHYTIDRDGKIYQHVGEERIAWHVKGSNTNSIGIELQILRAWKGKKSLGSCNSIDKTMAKKMGMSQEALVRQLCAPTPEQYRALKGLIADIKSRHPVPAEGVVGHCELVRRGGHGDPRAFDWEKIDLSNTQKLNFVKTNNTACSWYHLY